jgi:hypothetical protein
VGGESNMPANTTAHSWSTTVPTRSSRRTRGRAGAALIVAPELARRPKRKPERLRLGEQVCLPSNRIHGKRHVFLHNQPFPVHFAVDVGLTND